MLRKNIDLKLGQDFKPCVVQELFILDIFLTLQ